MSLVVDRQRKLASAFHEHMTKGEFPILPFFCENNDFLQFVEKSHHFDDDEEREHGQFVWQHEDSKQAGEMLCHLIDAQQFLNSDKGPRRPLVVLAFDEADALTDNPANNNERWNLFSELRRVLRQLNKLPIFSLFLSTAGRSDLLSPDIHSDPSARVREPDYRSLDPITEISFDDIAYPTLKGTIAVEKAATIDWMSHLGRPL